jgi:hypothetical protein
VKKFIIVSLFSLTSSVVFAAKEPCRTFLDELKETARQSERQAANAAEKARLETEAAEKKATKEFLARQRKDIPDVLEKLRDQLKQAATKQEGTILFHGGYQYRDSAIWNSERTAEKSPLADAVFAFLQKNELKYLVKSESEYDTEYDGDGNGRQGQFLFTKYYLVISGW